MTDRPLAIQQRSDVLLELTVQPRASRTELVARPGGLVLRVTAPPVERAANEACLRFLADCLGLSRSRITLIRGGSARRKLFRVEAGQASTIAARLESQARRSG